MCKLSKPEQEMLKMLGEMETGLVADKLGISPDVIYQRLYRIRKRRRNAQILVNQLNNFERVNSRLRRFLTPTKVTSPDE